METRFGTGDRATIARDRYLENLLNTYYSLHICAGGKDGYLVERNAAKLGKVKTGRSCINFNKREDPKL